VRGFSVAVGASFLLFAALYGSVFFLAQFLQTGLGYGPFKAGLLLVPWTATLIVVAPLAGALGDRIGERPLVVGGLVLNAAGLGAVALLADPGVAYPPLLVALVVAGVGGSAAIPVIQSALIGAVKPSAIGKASGANNMSQELGGAFGVAILVTVFTAAGSYASPAAFSDGFVPAMAASAALAFAGALVAAGLPGRGAKAPAATAQAAEDRGAAAE
jgi:MFS family permease